MKGIACRERWTSLLAAASNKGMSGRTAVLNQNLLILPCFEMHRGRSVYHVKAAYTQRLCLAGDWVLQKIKERLLNKSTAISSSSKNGNFPAILSIEQRYKNSSRNLTENIEGWYPKATFVINKKKRDPSKMSRDTPDRTLKIWVWFRRCIITSCSKNTIWWRSGRKIFANFATDSGMTLGKRPAHREAAEKDT